MRTGKILPWWGGSLALSGLLLGVLSQAQATDLCLPRVHQFRFIMLRIPATGAGPLGDGTVYPGLTFPNGAQAGLIYKDLTQHKLKLVLFGPDGATPVSAVWQDFTGQVQYSYNYQTQACTKSTFNLAEGPACLAQNANLLGPALTYAKNYRWDFYVAANSPGHSVEAGMEANSTSKPMFFLRRDGTNTTDMRFYDLSAAPIDSSQFTPPASCLQ